jgi:transglutaminase-like putative cysteine protease
MSSLRLSIRHTTHYKFAAPVAHGLQRLRLTPKATQGQHIVDWSLDCGEARVELEYEDQHCNHVNLIAIPAGASEVVVTCSGVVATQDNAGVLGHHSGHLPLWAFLGHTPLTRPGAKVRSLAAHAAKAGEGTLAVLHSLSDMVREQVAYGRGASGVETTAEEALATGQGFCQDHAHVFIAAARQLDIPARYVSGYLMMNDRVDQEATHAWAEACVDGLGWVGFDVSNGISPDPRYVRLATGRDYADAAPITGISFGAASQELIVSLAVEQQIAQQ